MLYPLKRSSVVGTNRAICLAVIDFWFPLTVWVFASLANALRKRM